MPAFPKELADGRERELRRAAERTRTTAGSRRRSRVATAVAAALRVAADRLEGATAAESPRQRALIR